MIHIADVLKELGISNYALEKIPSTEDEFKKYFKKVVGEDSGGSAILSDDESKFGVTWSQITTKKTELEEAEKSMSDKDKAKQKLKNLGLTDDEITALVSG